MNVPERLMCVCVAVSCHTPNVRPHVCVRFFSCCLHHRLIPLCVCVCALVLGILKSHTHTHTQRDDPPRALCDFLESIVDVSAGLVDGTTKLRDRVAKSAERPWQDVVSACGADARACLACLSQAPSSGSRRVLLLLVFVVFALLAVVGSVVLANDPFALRPVWNVYREHPVVHRVQTLIADVGQAAQQSFSRITQ